MDRQPPSLYLLAGDDELAITEFLRRMQEKLGDPGSAAWSMQQFTPEALDFEALQSACSSAPFLSRRRLIVLRQCGAMLTSDTGRRERFFQLLQALPPTTALVLVEPQGSKAFESIRGWAQEHELPHFTREFAVPEGEAFAGWVRNRARQLGGEIDPAAAKLLAEVAGEDPGIVHQELTKLLDYVDRARPVRPEDVERLTPLRGQSDVFAMVDALGEGDTRRALVLLHNLLEHESPRYAFSMILRQFRLLTLARAALDRGEDPIRSLPVPGFVARKLAAQARGFALPELKRILHMLLDADLAIKTGQVEDTVALDTLIASVGPSGTH